MNIMKMFRGSGSAPVARERLQILLAHERKSMGGAPDLLALLREEILAAVGRHVSLDPDKIQIRLDRGNPVSTLEVDIEIPNHLDGVAVGLA